MPFVTLDATVSFPTAWSGGFTVERHDSLMSAPVRFFRSIQGRRKEGVREQSMQRRGMSWLTWTW